MNIRTFYNLTNDVYQVSIYTQDWSEGDRELMKKFGEPQINVGGSFSNPTFTLPDSLKNIMSESPFAQRFDLRDAADAKDRANRWATDMATTISDAVTTLRNNSDSYTKETVVTV